LAWLELPRGKFYDWRQHYGSVREQHRVVPRDHWLEPWEQQAILDFHDRYPSRATDGSPS
jgi:hypothetical protein